MAVPSDGRALRHHEGRHLTLRTSFSAASSVNGVVPTDDAEENAIIMVGIMVLKKAGGEIFASAFMVMDTR